jgi:hypothetical protein
MSKLFKLYEHDPTGTLPENRIKDEQHILTIQNDKDFQFIVPNLAPFFADTLIVSFKEAGTGANKDLIYGVDYYATHVYTEATHACAKPVYGSITFLKNLAGIVTISYNTLGGKWLIDEKKIQEILADRIHNPRVTTWEEVAKVPERYPPIEHDQDLVDMVGMKDLVSSLARIEDYLRTKSSDGLKAHIDDKNNPHNVTKEQVGLGNINNLPILPISEVNDTSDNYYITPRAVRAILDAFIIPIINLHLNNKDNPHEVTAEQIKAYTKLEVDGLLKQYLKKRDTAVNTYRFGGLDSEEFKTFVLDGTAANSKTLEGRNLQQIMDAVSNKIVNNTKVWGMEQNEFKQWALNGKAADSALFNGMTFENVCEKLTELSWDAATLCGLDLLRLSEYIKNYLETNGINSKTLNGKTAQQLSNDIINTITSSDLDAKTLNGKTLDQIISTIQAASQGDAGMLNGKTEEELRKAFMVDEYDSAYVNTIVKAFNKPGWSGNGTVLQHIASLLMVSETENSINALTPCLIKIVGLQTPYQVNNGRFNGSYPKINWDLVIDRKYVTSTQKDYSSSVNVELRCNVGTYHDLVNDTLTVVKPTTDFTDVFFTKSRKVNENGKENKYLDIYLLQPPLHATGIILTPTNNKDIIIPKTPTIIVENLNDYKGLSNIELKDSLDDFILNKSIVNNELSRLNLNVNSNKGLIDENKTNLTAIDNKLVTINNKLNLLDDTNDANELNYTELDISVSSDNAQVNNDLEVLVPLVTFKLPVNDGLSQSHKNYGDICFRLKGFNTPASWGNYTGDNNSENQFNTLNAIFSVKRKNITLSAIESIKNSISTSKPFSLQGVCDVAVTWCGKNTMYQITDSNGQNTVTPIFDGKFASDLFYFTTDIEEIKINNGNESSSKYVVTVNLYLRQKQLYSSGIFSIISKTPDVKVNRTSDVYVKINTKNNVSFLVSEDSINNTTTLYSELICNPKTYNDEYIELKNEAGIRNDVLSVSMSSDVNRLKLDEINNKLTTKLNEHEIKINSIEQDVLSVPTKYVEKTNYNTDINRINNTIGDLNNKVTTITDNIASGQRVTKITDGNCVIDKNNNGKDLNTFFIVDFSNNSRLSNNTIVVKNVPELWKTGNVVNSINILLVVKDQTAFSFGPEFVLDTNSPVCYENVNMLFQAITVDGKTFLLKLHSVYKNQDLNNRGRR